MTDIEPCSGNVWGPVAQSQKRVIYNLIKNLLNPNCNNNIETIFQNGKNVIDSYIKLNKYLENKIKTKIILIIIIIIFYIIGIICILKILKSE